MCPQAWISIIIPGRGNEGDKYYRLVSPCPSCDVSLHLSSIDCFIPRLVCLYLGVQCVYNFVMCLLVYNINWNIKRWKHYHLRGLSITQTLDSTIISTVRCAVDWYGHGWLSQTECITMSYLTLHLLTFALTINLNCTNQIVFLLTWEHLLLTSLGWHNNMTSLGIDHDNIT